ncbi:MAG: response regulator [Algoriphagus sp.]|uniref:response regulator n=1 Tax=Algoriphagus sp. TaxID=1872435 RepID=UPI00179FC67F|nr:response regulator [Algoriphagus sp.]NVJ85454.1 response regulator [Algoriphagus sp.]
MKILIVDDEKDVELLFRQKFRKEVKSGVLELAFAFSGEEALKVLDSEHPPKVIYVFSDINMPGMSGLELLNQVKNQFPEIQVSMISAYGDSQNYEKAMQSGAKEFFTKPIDFESLKVEVNKLIESQK